ncbi:MAG: hypothetical protein GY938_31690 [Ketobacter sp.]|nr:hypothetical protein [Ketobacter sp.]
MTDTFIKLPDPWVKERSSSTATAYFRDSSDAAEAPTTVHYRIDDLTTGTAVKDWTSATAAVSVAISITSAENQIYDSSNERERRQITVAADKDTDTETRDTAVWIVNNIGGFAE